MDIKNTKDIYLNRICKYCAKNKDCDHSFIYEEKFLNGINNIRCVKYQYKKDEVDNNE